MLLTWGSKAGIDAPSSKPLFDLPLIKSLVPLSSGGSSTPTFTRATTKYIADQEGLLKQMLSGEAGFTGARRVFNSLATTSEDFSNAAWVKDATTTVTGGQSDPLGGTAAYKLENVTAAHGIFNNYSGITTASNVWSVWLRGAVGGEVVRLGLDATTVTITTAWQRFTTSGTGDAFMRIRANAANQTIFAFRAMVETTLGQTNVNPSEYVSKGVLSAPFHGANVDGVKYFDTQNGNTVASNVVTEATGAGIATTTTLGYNAEGARTNLFIQSNDWTNVAWVKTTMTTALTSTGPDGVANSATRLTASGALATVLQLLVAGASSRTWSVWARRVTGTGTIKLFQGATKTADLASSLNSVTYTRIEQNASVDITLLGAGIEIGTSTDAIDVWCGQFEAGAFASSPIPSTTVAVTRNADVLTYVSAGNANVAQGAVYCEATKNPLQTVYQDLVVIKTAATDGVELYIPGSASFDNSKVDVLSGSVTTASVGTTSNPAVGSTRKFACSYSVGDTNAFVGGAAGTADTSSIMPASLTTIQIAGWSDVGTPVPALNIKNIRIYATALSAAQLQAMTA